MTAIEKIALPAANFSCAGSEPCAKGDFTLSNAPDLGVAQCEGNSVIQPEISKWGGARTNSGGKREGAGRPRKQPERAIQARPLGLRWYVVEFAFGQAHRVIRDIIEGESREGREPRPGYRAEMPMLAVRRLRRGVWSVDHVPMFPGYAFVEFDAVNQDWAPIRHIEGVAQLFMTRSMRPIPLPVGFVEWLVDTAADRLSLRAAKMAERQPGTKISVTSGPFDGFPAVVVECDGITTTASLEVFGRMVPVTLPYSAFVGRV